eukprot:scaffold32957_cov52-Prasinocladus_malaysianus.AAC.1
MGCTESKSASQHKKKYSGPNNIDASYKSSDTDNSSRFDPWSCSPSVNCGKAALTPTYEEQDCDDAKYSSSQGSRVHGNGTALESLRQSMDGAERSGSGRGNLVIRLQPMEV